MMVDVPVKNSETLYRHCTTISELETGSEQLIDKETEAIIHLNSMGREIWDVTRSPACWDEIVAACGRAFPELAQDMLEREVERALSQLVTRELLRVSERQSAP